MKNIKARRRNSASGIVAVGSNGTVLKQNFATLEFSLYREISEIFAIIAKFLYVAKILFVAKFSALAVLCINDPFWLISFLPL